MVLYLPSWLPQSVVELVAGHLPVGNEDTMRRVGDVWSDNAEWCREQAKLYEAKAKERNRIIRGHSGDKVEDGYYDLADNFRSQADYSDSLAREQYEGANSLEMQRWTVYGFAIILGWTLIHAAIMFAAGGWLEAVVAKMRTDTALRILSAKLLEYLAGATARRAAERGVIRLAGKMALIGALQGGGMNAAVQLKQIEDGHRDKLDRKSIYIAGAAGGIGGGIGMLFGRLLGNRFVIPATTALAQKTALTSVRISIQIFGTAVIGLIGGFFGGLAGAAASLGMSREDFTWGKLAEGLGPAVTGGFIGAAAHGAAGIRAAGPVAAGEVARPAAGEAAPVARTETPTAPRPLSDAVDAHARTTAEPESGEAPAGRRKFDFDELLKLAGVDVTADRPASSRVVNSENWKPPVLENVLSGSVDPFNKDGFAPLSTHAAKAEAPKLAESQPTPLQDGLATHIASAKEAGAAPQQPADGEVSGARPGKDEEAHSGPGTVTAAPHPADSEVAPGVGKARGHGGSNDGRSQDGPANAPKTSETPVRGESSEGGAGAGRGRAEGDSGEGSPPKDESGQPVEGSGAVRQESEKLAAVGSEHPRSEQNAAEGQVAKASAEGPEPTLSVVSEPKAVPPLEQGRARDSAARPQPGGKAATGEAQTTAQGEPGTAAGGRPPRVSAPKSAAGEKPPAIETNGKQGERGASPNKPESEHGRATAEGEQQAKNHPDEGGTHGKQKSEADQKPPDEEGGNKQADGDTDSTGKPAEPEPEHARTEDDNGKAPVGDDHPADGTDADRALALAYKVEAEDILAEYTSMDWSKFSDDDLKQMLVGTNDRKAVLAVLRIIEVADGKVLRVEQLMGVQAVRDGHVGKMQAGEGKTLVFQAAAALVAARGKPVRVLTTRDTLALEAYEISQRLFGKFGFDLRLMDPDHPYAPASEDVPTMSFGTMNSEGFGELRGNTAPGRVKMADEGDEAIKGLFVLSEGAGEQAGAEITARVEDAHGFLEKAVAADVLSEADFVRAAGSVEDHTKLTGNDRAAVERMLGSELTGKIERMLGRVPTEAEAHRIAMAANAKWRTRENDDYIVWHHSELGSKYLTDEQGNVIVRNGERVLNPDSHRIYIIDPVSHKVMYDPETGTESRWNGGLAQAIEAKHGIRIRADPASAKSITALELFSPRLCDEASVLTATTDNADAELRQLGREPSETGDDTGKPERRIIDIPRHKKSELKGADPENDIHVANQEAKHEAMADGVVEVHATGRPIEVICDRNSEVAAVSKKLTARGIEHIAIDAKWFLEQKGDAEANLLAIFKKAGEEGMVLVINRQGARGVDIPISAEINGRGGLHVVKSSRSAEHRDVDIQAENRTARSGGQGSVQYYVAADDPLFAKSPRAQITFIKYIAAEAQHNSAVAGHETAVAEHNAAPTAQTRAKLAAAVNTLDISRKNFDAAAADVKGLVSKLQPSGVVQPTTDAGSAHMPNAPPAAGSDPAVTPASGRPAHQPPEQPPPATPDAAGTPAAGTDAPAAAGRTPASVTAIGRPGAIAAAGTPGAIAGAGTPDAAAAANTPVHAGAIDDDGSPGSTVPGGHAPSAAPTPNVIGAQHNPGSAVTGNQIDPGSPTVANTPDDAATPTLAAAGMPGDQHVPGTPTVGGAEPSAGQQHEPALPRP